jgi:hypothetical protein
MSREHDTREADRSGFVSQSRLEAADLAGSQTCRPSARKCELPANRSGRISTTLLRAISYVQIMHVGQSIVVVSSTTRTPKLSQQSIWRGIYALDAQVGRISFHSSSSSHAALREAIDISNIDFENIQITHSGNRPI